jgi:hypothetical protein
MVMLTKCVDMISLAHCFEYQQLELAIAAATAAQIAVETNPLIVFFPAVLAVALAFVSKLLHLVIIV